MPFIKHKVLTSIFSKRGSSVYWLRSCALKLDDQVAFK